MTQPTASSTEGQQLVSPPGKGPISPGQALYKDTVMNGSDGLMVMYYAYGNFYYGLVGGH